MKQLDPYHSTPNPHLLRQSKSYARLNSYYPQKSLNGLNQTGYVPISSAMRHQDNHHAKFLLDELTCLANALNQLITETQSKTGISDVDHPRYPSLAKEASRRRDNLLATVSFLQTQVERHLT
jgi:hypothetical protein